MNQEILLQLSGVKTYQRILASSVADEADTSRRQQDQIAYLLEAYERAKASGVSQQDFAASQDILRSSLHTPEIRITRQVVK